MDTEVKSTLSYNRLSNYVLWIERNGVCQLYKLDSCYSIQILYFDILYVIARSLSWFGSRAFVFGNVSSVIIWAMWFSYDLNLKNGIELLLLCWPFENDFYSCSLHPDLFSSCFLIISTEWHQLIWIIFHERFQLIY